MPKPNRLAEFHRLRAIETDECVIWPYGKYSNGYGQVFFERHCCSTHRLALILATGSDQPGLDAAHGPCHNRLCMNVRHLSWKTRSENNHDKKRDGTDDCGEKHYAARLTEPQVREILASTGPTREVAFQYGVARQTVYNIRSGRNWKHLRPDVVQTA